MSDLISVVVPVYNVEKYLRKCVDSILSQTYRNIELILVDDGATDHSGEICDSYKYDNRVQVIHKQNGGLSSARNIGMENIHGEYLLFIDSDDWIDQDYIEILHENAIQFKADICAPAFCLVYEDGREVNDCRIKNVTMYDTVEALTNFLFNGYLTPCVASKLWKTELWNNIRCPEGKLFEDQYTTYKLLDRARRVVFNPRTKYHYLKRNGSIGHSKFSSKTYDLLMAIREEYNYITEKYPETRSTLKVARAFWELVFVNMMINSNMIDIHTMRSIQRRTKESIKEILSSSYIDTVRKIELSLFATNFNLYKIVYRLYKYKHAIT